ncbi:glycoside hydrolase [bacterium]|nr:MAG: glycoside hydrolase [bacterium]
MKKGLIIALIGLLSYSCETYNAQGVNQDQVNALSIGTTETNLKNPYKNPVLNADFPDPQVFKASNGWFYAYATQTPGKNIQAAKSKDMVHWEILGDAMPVKPKWSGDTQNFWAPHVLEDKGKYYMYYSGEIRGLGYAISVAKSDSPEGPFVDNGTPIVKGESFVNIDPMPFDDPKTKKKYLYWGSGFQPIKVQELDNDRSRFAAGSKPVNVVNPQNIPYEHLIEGAWVVYRNGYYYMYYSGDNCCEREPLYGVLVARSKSATGPFQKMAEVTKKENSLILEKNDVWTGVGHNSIITDAKGQDWIVYHGIDRKNFYIPGTQSVRRPMLIDKVDYKNGWPVIKNSEPSSMLQEGPAL